MTIKDYKQFLNSLPKEFDDFEITHREYIDMEGEKLNAKEIPVYSVHIDELQKVACNMHMESYKLYNKFINKNNE